MLTLPKGSRNPAFAAVEPYRLTPQPLVDANWLPGSNKDTPGQALCMIELYAGVIDE